MSVWSNMRSKSNGDFRKEDMFEFFGPDRISPDDLGKMLKEGIVHFKYRKKPRKGQPEDKAEEREAWGTKFMEIVDRIPDGGPCPPKDAGYTTYFDIEKQGWRVFLDSRLIETCPKVLTLDEYEKNFKNN